MNTKNYFFTLITLFCALVNTSFSQTHEVELNNLIADALKNNPEVRMMKSKIESADNRIPQNSNLPDPNLSIGLVNLPVNSFSFTQEPMTGKMISLTQGIPFPGKLSANEDFMKMDVKISNEELNETINKIKLKVSGLYYELSYLRKSIMISGEMQSLLKDISEVVRTKYSVNEASQENVLKVDLAITQIDNKISGLRSQENVIVRTFKNLLYYEPEFTFIDSLLNGTLDTLSYSGNQLSITEKNRPVLRQIKLLEEKSNLMENLADFDFYPDFKVTVQYNQRDRLASTDTDLKDFLSVIFGVSIPINYGGKKSAKINEARSLSDYYKNQYDSYLQMISIAEESSKAKISSFLEREKLITEGLLNQAAHTFQSALAGYQVGQLDFINVIDAVNIETELYRIRADYFEETANLKYQLGIL